MPLGDALIAILHAFQDPLVLRLRHRVGHPAAQRGRGMARAFGRIANRRRRR